MNYFHDCETVEQIKAEYRRLARLHHPDLGGDAETMKAVNNAYEAALKGCNGQESTDSKGKTHTYRYNETTEREIMEKIQELLALDLPNINIDLIGLWVWISGDTRPVKDALKGAGCRWHSQRGCWYWKPAGLSGGWRSSGDLDELAQKYGVTRFKNSPKAKQKKLA